MRKSIFKAALIVAVAFVTLASCTSTSRTMREPAVRLDLTKSDFTLSEQVSAQATQTVILGIDWARLFSKRSANAERDGGFAAHSIPVVGGLIVNPTAGYALYEMMSQNPGYDVVLFPQYDTRVIRPLGIPLIFQTTTVTATARLGKLKE